MHTSPSLSIVFPIPSYMRHASSITSLILLSHQFRKERNLERPHCVVFSILLLFSLGQILSLVTGAQILVLGLKPSFMPLFVIPVS